MGNLDKRFVDVIPPQEEKPKITRNARNREDRNLPVPKTEDLDAGKKTSIGRRAGRPRIEDADKTLKASKPWVKLKMSKRTWYRRQKEDKKI